MNASYLARANQQVGWLINELLKLALNEIPEWAEPPWNRGSFKGEAQQVYIGNVHS